MAELNTTLANRPRTRQRAYKKPPALEVPDIDDDATERKRVLNVLAQRRYREKKRLNRLKAKSAGSDDPINSESHTAQVSESEILTDDAFDISNFQGSMQTTATIADANMTIPVTTADVDIMAGLDLSMTSWSPLTDITLTSVLPDPNTLSAFLTEDNPVDEAVTEAQHDLPLDFDESYLTTFIDTSSLSTSSSSSPSQGFPDSFHLPVLELTLLKAVTRIADRLNCKQTLWELDGSSPFITGVATPADQLPATWRPTRSQITIPHHPMFDLLPWPGVRDRVIFILSLPDELRPPQARGGLAIVNFAYDIEDGAEGVRIYGEDPYDPKNWELGQVAFERWWFLFDGAIIETSNRWRRMRGAPPLLLKSGSASTSPSASATSATSFVS
ncbi:hypothetical protein FSARC_6452 [Fusarium sarcochroum]|uniref:BZIP domain-containing protein n=1 Tax=Fusarium sarcochroum TaxID=1208366 RepID=A0A8H4TX53_9HYPO|nr:hypothetical protein FSARC_6452 [Fusarium sarcochroum]